MADVMLSYAREDRPTAELLARRLEQEGLDVWWDPEIPPGTSFDEVIDAALRSARWVVVLWSGSSVGSRWVVAEAEEATIHAKLVPALIDDIVIPLAFRRIQAADLIGWRGETDHPGYRALVATLHSRPATLAQLPAAAMAAGAPAPVPSAPSAPSVPSVPSVASAPSVPSVPPARSVPSARSAPPASGSPRRRSHALLPAVLVLLIGAAGLAAWWIASDDGGTSPSPAAPAQDEAEDEAEDDTAIDEGATDVAAETGTEGGQTPVPPPPPPTEPSPSIPPFPAALLSEPLNVEMPLADPRPAASPHDVAAAYLHDSLANLEGCPEAYGEVIRVDVDGDATAVVDIVASCMDHADSLIPHAGGLRYTLRMQPNDAGSWEVIEMVPQVYCPDGVVRGALCNE